MAPKKNCYSFEDYDAWDVPKAVSFLLYVLPFLCERSVPRTSDLPCFGIFNAGTRSQQFLIMFYLTCAQSKNLHEMPCKIMLTAVAL